MEPSMEPPAEPHSNAALPAWASPPPTRPSNGRRWLLIGGLALAFALVLGVGAVVGAALHPTAQAASFEPGSGNFAQGPGFGQRQFAGTPGAQAQCGTLTVTSVSGQTIVATASDGSSVTIHTSSSTQYTKGGQAATASDVTVGSKIHADGTANSDGSITATHIDIQ